MHQFIDEYGTAVMVFIAFAALILISWSLVPAVAQYCTNLYSGVGTSIVDISVVAKSTSGIILERYTVKGEDGKALIITPHLFNGYNEPSDTTIRVDVENIDEVEIVYEPITYTISYELGDGAIVGYNPTTYTIEDETIRLNNPTRNGYIFKGWLGAYTNGLNMDVEIKKGSFGDRTYTAVWEAPFMDGSYV